jgi:hypothetical protein
MSVEILKQRLEDPAFYKKHIPNLFFIFSFWKKTYREYQSAKVKKILPNYLLRRSEQEDFFYNTYVLSTSGQIDTPMLQKLESFVRRLGMGEIRYMAHGTNGFFPLQHEDKVNVYCPALKSEVDVENLYFFTLSDTKPTTIECPYSVFIQNGNELKKWPILKTALF